MEKSLLTEWHWLEEHFFRVDEVFAAIICELKVIAQNNRSGWTRLLAVPTEDTTDHVDLVPNGISFARAISLGVRILARLNVDATCRTSACTKGATDARLLPALVAR